MKKLKCHNCKKLIPSRLLVFSNVCSEECAIQLSKKIEEKFQKEEALNEKKNNPKPKVEPKPKKEKKVKCLGCSKMIEVSGSKNVCSLKCAEKYTKKYISNMQDLDEEQRKNWEQSPYYPLVKEYEEKVIADYKKNKIPNKPDYSVFKKPNIDKLINEIQEITGEDLLKKYSELLLEMDKVCKVTDCCKIPKGWGHELIIHNCPEYCGKILVFKNGCKFSMHYHILKQETWYVNKGSFLFTFIDTEKAITHSRIIKVGDVVTITRGMPHQLLALMDGEVFEISTEHFDSDSYRIAKGD
jgi:mannose-6-phosphate isomerase-like protein (cupin superfamily)